MKEAITQAALHKLLDQMLPEARDTSFSFWLLSQQQLLLYYFAKANFSFFFPISEMGTITLPSPRPVKYLTSYCCHLVIQSHPTVTPWTVARQASLSFTISCSLLKLMSIESVMPSTHLILSYSSPPAFNLSQHQGLFQ